MAKTQSTPKKHGSNDEIYILVKIKRERATEAMGQIVKGLAKYYAEIPPITLLLDYLSNMAYALELMLKLLTNEWHSHNIENMYRKAFPRTSPSGNRLDLLFLLEAALRDQKYVLDPVDDNRAPKGKTIADYIEEIETLFRDLRGELVKAMPRFQVGKTFVMDEKTARFIQSHLALFVNDGDTLVPTNSGPEVFEQVNAKFKAKLESIYNWMGEHIKTQKGIEFMTCFHAVGDILS